jgi:hypothetical protein
MDDSFDLEDEHGGLLDGISSGPSVMHYGVKGMHWGVRRAEANKRNPGYTAKDRAKDRRSQSSGGAVRRINKRMNKGQDLVTARKNEKKFVDGRRKIVSAAVLGVRYRKHIAAGARVLKVLGPLLVGVAVQSVAQRAETNRGRAFVANTMGIPQHASTGPSATKQNRKGVYNISSL